MATVHAPNVIVLFDAGWNRTTKPGRHAGTLSKRCPPWQRETQPIPRHEVDRDLVRRITEAAKKRLDEHRDTIKAMLAEARLAA
jgi:hypothetical protein